MKTLINKKSLFIVLGLLAGCIIAGGAVHLMDVQHVESLKKLSAAEYITQATKKLDSNSTITVGTLENGKTTIKYYGKDGEISRPPKVDYELGSITKTMTAGMIYRLVKAGKISLDDTIDKYLELTPGTYPTIRDVLTHTAGYETFYPKHLLAAFNPMNDFDRSDAVTVLNRHNSFRGADFTYSNFGYAVLGAIIEKVSGASYADVAKDYLINDYSLAHTGLWSRDAKYNNDNLFSWVDADFYRPAGAAVSNIDDMMAYLQASIEHYNSDREQYHILKNVHTNLEQIRGFGLSFEAVSYGWLVDTTHNIWAHPGELPTSTAFIGFNPDKKFGVVVLINQAPSHDVTSKLLGAKLLNELTD